jgi:hypothetical protein
MKSAHFNTIAIIQSIPQGELRTGARLREDLEILNVAHDHDLSIKLFDVDKKDEFVKTLKSLTDGAKQKGLLPVVHIESHGSSDQKGLVLASGDFVSWRELKPLLIELNIATRNNLLVFLAACNGAHLIEVVDLTDRSPCWGLAGPEQTTSSADLLKSFGEFYKVLLSSGSGDKAITAMNSVNDFNKTKYIFMNAEAFFKKVYKSYMKNECNNSALQVRARRMRKLSLSFGATKKPSVGMMKRLLKRSQEDYFNKYKNQYFMIDLFPENSRRFTVDYKSVVDF